MEIGFDHIKDLTIGELLRIAQDKNRIEKENTYLKTKYPRAKEELEREDFDINKFIEDLNGNN
jgi:hypothetical protein